MSHTRLGILTLIGLICFVGIAHLFGSGDVLGSKTFNFSFEKTRNDANLESLVKESLAGSIGDYAVYIEELPASPSASLKNPRKFAQSEHILFPAASLYKLILMAAIEKEIERGKIQRVDMLSSSKAHLSQVLGNLDFGYEEAPEKIGYSVDEALTRVGRISDNFAAIMLTEKLRQMPEDGLLYQMVKELGMNQTDFSADPIQTTAFDIAAFFKLLYQGRVVSTEASERIKGYLNLSKINDRIPKGVPDGVQVIHKTGEFPRLRHDGGIVYLEGHPYILVLMSQNLKYEDDGIETLVKISKDIYTYFEQNKGK